MVFGMFVLHLRKQSKMEFFRSWFIVNYLRRYTPTSHQSSEKSYYRSEEGTSYDIPKNYC